MEKISRKGFLKTAAAGAAAVGAAAFIPSATANADPTENKVENSEVAPLAKLNISEIEHGAESLAGTEWAKVTADGIDVIKSYNGLHFMSAENYIAFTGWDSEHDQPTEIGFGLVSNGELFLVRASTFEFNGGTPFEYSSDEMETGKRWLDGKEIYRKVINTGSFSNNTNNQIEKRINHGIQGISTVVSISGTAQSNSYDVTVSLPRSITQPNAGNGIDLQVTSSQVVLAIGPQNSFDSSFVIVEYTK